MEGAEVKHTRCTPHSVRCSSQPVIKTKVVAAGLRMSVGVLSSGTLLILLNPGVDSELAGACAAIGTGSGCDCNGSHLLPTPATGDCGCGRAPAQQQAATLDRVPTHLGVVDG